MACFVCVCFLTQCFLIVFTDFDMLLAARHGFVLSCFCCCMDCPQSLGLGHGLRSVDCWADLLLGVCYMDCLSWFLGCHIVACIVICCLMCVMDCDLLLGVRHGLFIMVSWLPGCYMDCDLSLGVCVCVMDCVSCFLGRCVTCCCIDLICCLV